MTNFSINERQVGNVTVLDIRGSLNGVGGRSTLHNAIHHPLEEGHNQILLNLAKVSSIDSSCLGVLVSSHFDLIKKGGQLKIIHLSARLKKLMTIKDLYSVFDVYEYGDESEALKSFENPFDFVGYRNTLQSETYHRPSPSVWGELDMNVSFLVEQMQGRSHLERTFSVKELLPSGRVTLNGMYGQYVKESFEKVEYSNTINLSNPISSSNYMKSDSESRAVMKVADKSSNKFEDQLNLSAPISTPIHWLTHLFGCWHRNMGTPFTLGSQTYCICTKCGAHRKFDTGLRKNTGPYYYNPDVALYDSPVENKKSSNSK